MFVITHHYTNPFMKIDDKNNFKILLTISIKILVMINFRKEIRK